MFKRGSQTEIIISFGIFIIFIILLFLVIKPIKFDEEKNFLLKHLEVELVNELESDLISTSFVNKTPLDKDTVDEKTCVKLLDIQEVQGLKVIVKNKNKIQIPAKHESGFLYVKSQKNDGSHEDFFNFYYSEFLTEDKNVLTDCEDFTNPDKYTLGLIKNLSFISYNKIQKLANEMENPAIYHAVKERLGVPDSNDFSFFLKNNSGEKLIITNNEKIPGSSVEVYTSEFPINYIDDNANINQGWINIQVW